MAAADDFPPSDGLLAAMRSLLAGLLEQPESRRLMRQFALDVAAALADEGGAQNLSDTSLCDTTEIEIPVQRASPRRPAPTTPEVEVVSPIDAIKQLKWARSADSRLSASERQTVAERADAPADANGKSSNWRSVGDQELAVIPTRCQLKAEACRWKLERKRLMEAGRRYAEEIEPRDKSLIARAKQLPDCFLWMNFHDGPAVGAALAWDYLADCFETLGEAVVALQDAAASMDEFPDLFKEALLLSAEAQSAVRSGAREVGYDDEQEQDRTYNWLKRVAAERGHYIGRYMRVDDPADPTQSEDLRRRLAEFRERFETRRGQDKTRRKRLGQVKYLSGQIQREPEADHAYNWQKLIAAVDELVQAGEPPSSKEIRRHLLPILDDLPAGDLPLNVELVLREIDRFLAENPGEEPAPTTVNRHAPQVLEVARRLAGRTMVLIGGVRKPGHMQALQEAFRLKEVVWVPTREHQSVSKFEPYVRQPDVALVVLAIRWTSHSYGEVKEYCDLYGKPFVRLKAGYNPVQVATHILEQVSDQLPGAATQSESA
jgi:hypothetical protein